MVWRTVVNEQGHASLRSAEATALEVLGESTKALEIALQAMQVRKRLGYHSGGSKYMPALAPRVPITCTYRYE